MSFETLAQQILEKGREFDEMSWAGKKERTNRLLRKQIELCAKFHPFYRKMFQECGINPMDIRSVDDLECLPLTKKQAYMAQPEDFKLQLNEGSGYERVIYDITYTTGTTTGVPTPFYSTTHDILAVMEQFIRTCRFYGIHPSRDVLINLYPMSMVPHIGFRNSTMIGWPAGIPVINTLPGSQYNEFPMSNPLDWCVEVIEHFKGTVVRGVSSFIRKVVMRAQELNKDYSSMRFVFCLGEATPKMMREDIRRRFQSLGAKGVKVFTNYGFTEMQYSTFECAENGAYHNFMSDYVFFEIVEPETGRRVQDGREGHVAMTHVNRRGTILLRYLTGDLCSVKHDRCPMCEREGQRFTMMPYRTADLVKIKGTLINPQLIQQELAAVPWVGEYQVVFSKEDPADPLSLDTLIVRVAPEKNAPSQEIMEAVIKRQIKAVVEITPRVEITATPEDIFNPEKSLKAARIVDERPRLEG
ncbi:MAG: AMP-binding protein [Deltaproteobacteria bacterium]|nr:AMP-binding protein [Deltaproteobacteria bacterium]